MCLRVERQEELGLWVLGQWAHSKEWDEGVEQWVTVALPCRGGGDPGVLGRRVFPGPPTGPWGWEQSQFLAGLPAGAGAKGGAERALGSGIHCLDWDIDAGARHCPQLPPPPSSGCGLRAEPSIKQTASLCLSVPTFILTESGFHHPLIIESSHSLCLSIHTY